MSNDNFKSLDMTKFLSIGKERSAHIENASSKPDCHKSSIEALVQSLHPKKQHLVVKEVIPMGRDCKSYVLVPDTQLGTTTCAYFSAGQYITIFIEAGNICTTRAYSLSSSPSKALKGSYRITVKRVEGGAVSSYIFDNFKEGTKVTASQPMGLFVYESLRDAKHIVGIAGGSGVTPFVSLANAISQADEDVSLTLLYGAKTREDLVFEKELSAIAESCSKVKVVYVLSDEDIEGYEKGLIDQGLIKKYMTEGENSVFVCGSSGMYAYIKEQIKLLGIERKYVRYEHFGEVLSGEGCLDFDSTGKVKITVHSSDGTKVIEALRKDTVLRSLEKNKVITSTGCRSGECGLCSSCLLQGKVFVPEGRCKERLADRQYRRFHPCCSFPVTDIEIRIPKA